MLLQMSAYVGNADGTYVPTLPLFRFRKPRRLKESVLLQLTGKSPTTKGTKYTKE
jgi:hypothetical protein